jgi:cytochrome c553
MLLISLMFTFGVHAQERDLASAATRAEGQRKSATCVACHGEKGVSVNPQWPNLAGQKKEYLAKQLHDFRSGNRVDPVMSPIAKTIKEADINELAAYYSSLK